MCLFPLFNRPIILQCFHSLYYQMRFTSCVSSYSLKWLWIHQRCGLFLVGSTPWYSGQFFKIGLTDSVHVVVMWCDPISHVQLIVAEIEFMIESWKCWPQTKPYGWNEMTWTGEFPLSHKCKHIWSLWLLEVTCLHPYRVWGQIRDES